MKKVTALFFSFLLLNSIYAQNDTIKMSAIEEAETLSIETPDQTEVTFGKDEVMIIQDNGDSTLVQLGEKGLSIVEEENGTEINIVDMTDEIEEGPRNQSPKKHSHSKKFKPHWAGFSMGLNNYMNADMTFGNQDFMNLNTSRSWNYNLNFMEYGFGLGTSYAGLVTGLGVEWTNYVFDANNTIEEDANGNIINVPTPFPGVTKSSLKMSYLTVPLILEIQIPAGRKRIHLSGGVIGGVKMTSKTKVKYQDGGKQKSVIKDDYSLSPFRYGATFRVGYRAINLYANYYFSPLFSEVSTPELYPISIGLTLIPF